MHASQIQGCIMERRVEKKKKIAESVWVHNVPAPLQPSVGLHGTL